MGLFGPPDVEALKARGDIRGLIKALAYLKQADVRCRAVLALECAGDARAVEPLIAALNDDVWVQAAGSALTTISCLAAQALGKIGDARAVDPLIAVLKEPKGHRGTAKDLRSDAARALGRIADARAVEPLLVALKDSNEDVRRDAAEALGKIGDARAVEPLLVALKDSNWLVRERAAEALRGIGGTQLLISTLKHGDADVRRYAGESLLKSGAASAIEPLLAALKDNEKDLRKYAAETLGNIGDVRAVEPLITTLKDDDEYVRREAAKALGKLGDARAIEPLVAAIKNASVYRCVAAALAQLGWHPSEDESGAWYWVGLRNWERCKSLGSLVVEPLIAALKGDHETRRIAARILTKSGDARAVEPLISTLEDTEADVRISSIYALKEIADVRAVKPLITALKDSEKDVRSAALFALRKVSFSPNDLEPFVAVLKGGDVDSRRFAAEALGKIGDNRAIRPLLAAINDKFVYKSVAAALAQIHWTPGQDEQAAWYWAGLQNWDQCKAIGPAAVDVLVIALNDSSETVRQNASLLLAEVGDARAICPILDSLPDEIVHERYYGYHESGSKGPAIREDEVRQRLNALAEILNRHGHSAPRETLNRAASLKDIPCVHRERWENEDARDTVTDTSRNVIDCSGIRDLSRSRLAELRA